MFYFFNGIGRQQLANKPKDLQNYFLEHLKTMSYKEQLAEIENTIEVFKNKLYQAGEAGKPKELVKRSLTPAEFDLLQYLQNLQGSERIKLSLNNNKRTAQNKRLKWTGKPSHLAHLVLELVKKGYLEGPTHNGELSYSALGRAVFEVFDMDATEGNFAKECNPNKNTTSDSVRMKWEIPQKE